MKYYIITYGCQMNKADSERIATSLERKGYKVASNINEANLIVVNMCSVRQSAVDRVYGKIKEFQKLRAKNPEIKIVLSGCVLKSDLKKLKEHFDFFLKNKDYLKIFPCCKNKIRVLIPISYGCSNYCTYCVVPYTRGNLICRSHEDIIKEVKRAVGEGAKEIWLLGQNVNDYKYGNIKTRLRQNFVSSLRSEINFPKLLKMVSDIPGNFSVHFLSSNPKDFSDELIDVIARGKKISKYINLPLQSGDDKILKAMNRPYTTKEYKSLVEKIRKRIPNINLATDIIVGFPGETKKQFENTKKLIKEIKFDVAFIAKYSPRPGTAASKMKDNVPLKEKKNREKILREVVLKVK